MEVRLYLSSVQKLLPVAILIFCLGLAQAQPGWDNVRPAIQEPLIVGNELKSLNYVRILWCEEDLDWTVSELKRCLFAKGAEVETEFFELPSNPSPNRLPAGFEYPADGARVIRLGTWSVMRDIFQSTRYLPFQTIPKGESYYIDVESGVSPINITGKDIRQLNYAVSTLCQAVIENNGPALYNIAAVDYPRFEKRYIGYFQDFGYDAAEHYGVGGAWQDNIADSLLRLTRDVLLASKGNGVVHAGLPESYSSDNSNSANLSTILDNLAVEGRGDLFHSDKWPHFGFDWIEGIGWTLDETGGNNRGEVTRRFQVKTSATLVDNGGGTAKLNYKPNKPHWYFNEEHNWDFSDHDGGTGPLEFPEWNTPTTPVQSVQGSDGNGNYWCKWPNVGAGQTVFAETDRYSVVLDDASSEVGEQSPARQMVLRFKYRSSHLVRPAVKIELEDTQNFPLDPPVVATDGENANQFDLIEESKLPQVAGGAQWRTVEILFNSLDCQAVRLYIYFKNAATVTADSISLDDVEIFDADFYDVWGAADQDITVKLFRPGGPGGGYDASGHIHFEELQTLNTAQPYRIHHAEVTLDNGAWETGYDATDYDSAQVVYWVGSKTPLVFDVPTTGNPLALFGPAQRSPGRRENRMDSPNLFTPVMSDQMTFFNSEFSASGMGAAPSGYQCVEQEQKNAGYMPADFTGVEWSGQSGIGNFMQAMYDEIPRADNNWQYMVYGDAFDIGHNAARFTRRVNPHWDFGGLKRPEGLANYEIPGFDLQSRITFVAWEWHRFVADQNEVYNSDSSKAFWNRVCDPAHNSWDVMLGVGSDEFDSVDNNDNIVMSDELVQGFFEDLLSMASAEGNWTGGLLFTWGDEVANQNKNHKLYYPYRPAAGGDPGNPHGCGDWLQWLWKFTPIVVPLEPFAAYVPSANAVTEASYRIYPVPYRPEFIDLEMDSVVLEYRINHSSWLHSKVSAQSDSLYDFSISLPDSGGKVDYRVWSFEKFGTSGSYPNSDAKWDEPNQGDYFTFTFERRKNTSISKPDTFWLPGVISKNYDVKGGGRLVFQPLPGYKHATLYVQNDAKIRVLDNQSKVIFNGTDTTYIHVKPACPTCTWKGIDDSVGIVKKSYVTFHDGTGKAMVFEHADSDSSVELNEVVYEDTVIVTGPTKLKGNATFNVLIVDSGATLTVLPGSEFSFSEGGQLVVRDGGWLKAFGNDSTAIVFKAAVDSLPWEGIHCEVKKGIAACSLAYVSISGAVAGLLLDQGDAHIEHSTFTDNEYGVMVNNGGWCVIESCSLTTNTVGVLATNLSSVEIENTVVRENVGSGLKAISRATFYLTDCEINENDGDGLAGGIGLYTGSCAFLECTEVNANVGSGITAYGGTVMLTSVKTVGDTLGQWHGNRIEHNVTIPYEGQITLRNRAALALWNGHNCIQDTSGEGKLIHWEDQIGSDRWADTYWGSTDTAAIKTKLPSSVTLVRIDSSASSCPTFSADNTVHDSLVTFFLKPHNHEFSGQTLPADSGYRSIVRNSPSSDYTFSACDRMITNWYAREADFSQMTDTLDALYNAASDLTLKRWLRHCKAWSLLEDGDATKSRSLLDSLAGFTPTRFDRVAAKVQRQMLEIRAMRTDTTTEYKASECLAYLDSAQKVLATMKVWNQTTISDSVVMYAPVTVEGTILIDQPNGRLTILPHPGAEDPTVRFRLEGSITVMGTNGEGRGKLYVIGESDNRVNLDWDSTSAYGNIYSARGFVSLKHANLRGTGWVNLSEDPYLNPNKSPIFLADSCTFSGFDEGLWIMGGFDSCEIRNCTFESLGGGAYDYTGMDGSGLSLLYSDNVVVENCKFIDNDDAAIYGFYCDGIDISETEVSGSGEYGLMAWEAANINIECSNFHDNGDTLAEIWVEDGNVNLLDGFTRIADSSGVLIYSGHPSYTDLEDGENGLELLTSSGIYLKSGDTSAVWDITYNAWSPLLPTAGGFFNKLYPSNSSKWTVDSSLAEFIACGGGGISSAGENNLLVVDEDETSGTFSTESQSPDQKLAPHSKLAQGKLDVLATKKSRAEQHQKELEQYRTFKELTKSQQDKSAAIALGKKFLDENPNSSLAPSAVIQLTSLARRSKGKSNISAFLTQKALTEKTGGMSALYNRKACVAKAFEGNPAQALRDLEAIVEKSSSRRDSICALADAIGVYHAFRSSHDLTPKLASIKTESLPALKKRIRELSRQLDGEVGTTAANEHAVPTSYALYQNYPNPFNPSTEIRFDLPEAIRVELKIFNILGQEVATLVDDVRSAGAYQILWDGKNAGGLSVASGVYVYQIKAGNFQDAKKMVLLR